MNTFYYGVKYGRGADPETFWKAYFTSSHLVKDLREEYGEPDVAVVRKIFDPLHYRGINWAQQAAILHEQTVLRRIRAVQDDRFLNCSANVTSRTGDRIQNHKKYRHRKFGAYHSPEGVDSMREHNRKYTKENNPMHDPEIRAKHLNSTARKIGYRDYDHYLTTVRDAFVVAGTVKGTSEKLGHSQYAIRHLLIKNFGKEWVENIRKDGLQQAREKQASNRRGKKRPDMVAELNPNAGVWEAISPKGEVILLRGTMCKFKAENRIRKGDGWKFRKLGKVKDLM